MSIDEQINEALARFEKLDSDSVAEFVAFAPGRINLIGEHVDYMGGTVVPAAVLQGCVVAAGHPPRTPVNVEKDILIPNEIHIHSTAAGCNPANIKNVHALMDQVVKHSHENVDDALRAVAVAAAGDDKWQVYAYGVLLDALLAIAKSADKYFKKDDRVATLLVHSSVPMGAGMSSSAALCVALGYAMDYALHFNPKLDNKARAARARQVETRYKKVNIGIMDQMISICAPEEKSVLTIKCDVLETKPVGVTALLDGCNASLLLINSMKKHSLGDEYNAIRADMEKLQSFMQEQLGPKWTLVSCGEQTSMDEFSVRNFLISKTAQNEEITPQILARGAYVAEETGRSFELFQHLVQLDQLHNHASEPVPLSEKLHFAKKIGHLLNATHAGLRDDLKVSTPEIETIHKTAIASPDCFGGRLMGGGFGGCVLLLVAKGQENAIAQEVQAAMKKEHGIEKCDVFPVEIGRGAFTRALRE